MGEEVAAALARLDEQVAALTALTAVRDEAADRAVLKAEAANEKRFEAVNEFRTQLAAQAASFAARETVDAQILGLREKHDGDIAATRRDLDAARERVRLDLLEIRAQSSRLLFTVGVSIIGALVAALLAVRR
jgi:thioesterase domain-containing protein